MLVIRVPSVSLAETGELRSAGFPRFSLGFVSAGILSVSLHTAEVLAGAQVLLHAQLPRAFLTGQATGPFSFGVSGNFRIYPSRLEGQFC